MDSLGPFIQKKRKERGLSLRDFSVLCGLSHSYLDSLEKGKDPRTSKPVSPTIDTIKKLAKGLGLPINDLINIAIKDDDIAPPDKPAEESKDDIFTTTLAANMESEYGKKPSPEFLSFAINLRKQILEDIKKEKGQ